MKLPLLLKTIRIKNNLTQEQLSEKLFVSHQTISKWENGINVPSIDNLLMLSDVYNISLDELLRGSSYFRKPFLVGKKVSLLRIVFIGITWLLISLFFTGFGYQPIWLFLLVFLLGGINTICVVIDDYWIITDKGISIFKYPKPYLKKLKVIFQMLIKKETNQQFVSYKNIEVLEIVYTKKNRMSPFDFNPDYFYIRLTTTSMNKVDLQITTKFIEYLPQAISYIEKRKISVSDKDELIPVIVAGKNLFAHMNDK